MSNIKNRPLSNQGIRNYIETVEGYLEHVTGQLSAINQKLEMTNKELKEVQNTIMLMSSD